MTAGLRNTFRRPASARRLSTGGGAVILPSLRVLGGVAAAIGGLAWAVKAAAILATGDQPPLVFAVAPLFFGVALTALALTSDLRGGRRKTASALGLLTVTAGVVAGVTEAVRQVWGPAIAASPTQCLLVHSAGQSEQQRHGVTLVDANGVRLRTAGSVA